jgi:hypothetical protein
MLQWASTARGLVFVPALIHHRARAQSYALWRKIMLHRLTSWEDNGYDDSDFFVSVFDDETNQIRAVMSGSTRFEGYAPGQSPDIGTPISDPAILDRALQVLKDFIYKAIKAAEYRDVLEPSKVASGTRLRLLRDVKHKGVKLLAGTSGKAFWQGAFGQFFSKGYNRPDRSNTRAGVTLDDGSTAYVALSACRLDREPLTDEVLQLRAWDLAQYCGFSAATPEKHAWDSDNYALALYEKTKPPQRLGAVDIQAWQAATDEVAA